MPNIFKRSASATLANDFDGVFKIAFKAAKNHHEKNQVKVLVTKKFLSTMRSVMLRHLKKDWDVIVTSAYVDLSPRVFFTTAAGNDTSIEIGDILFISSKQFKRVRPGSERAWLIQAKRADHIMPTFPPVSSDVGSSDQHEFATTWPDFQVQLSNSGRSSCYNFKVKHSPALEWWAVVWDKNPKLLDTPSHPSKGAPGTAPWLGNPWIANKATASSVVNFKSFGAACSKFFRDSPSVGRPFSSGVWPPTTTKPVYDWNDLIFSLDRMCSDKQVTRGHVPGYQVGKTIGRRGVSSFLMTHPLTTRLQFVEAFSRSRIYLAHSYGLDQRKASVAFAHEHFGNVNHFRDPGDPDESDNPESGFAIIHAIFVQVGRRPKPVGALAKSQSNFMGRPKI